MLFSAMEYADLAPVDADAVVAVGHGYPPLGSDLYKKGVQTDIIDKYERVAYHVNARRQNDILPTAFQVHDGALVHPYDLQITDTRLDDIVVVLLVEPVNALQAAEVPDHVVPRSVQIRLRPRTFLRNHYRESVRAHVENRAPVTAVQEIRHQIAARCRVPLDHLHLVLKHLEVRRVNRDQVLIAQPVLKILIGRSKVLLFLQGLLVYHLVLHRLVHLTVLLSFLIHHWLVHFYVPL